MTGRPTHPVAQMLGGLLACVERPGDNRLNSHLDPLHIGETIRVAIDSLEAESGDVPRLRQTLRDIARLAVDAEKG